ncbi:EpsG family protein [Bacteroides cellulosilyticus]|jgi:hypothetical protein|uniref:EpsG family protein n=2 Tax=Bacteroides cellulosilyticus TaxID=246787 RepID=A0A412HZZ4_9BACE|nr:EpsG family protein [Bacteroides cellulosilyticus]RGS30188.1 EpsG family protein [Bacteroides cellulosilyticus]
MWIYLIVFLFSSFLFYIAAKREKKWNVTAFFAILIPSLLAGLRDLSIGTDTVFYYDIYDAASSAESYSSFLLTINTEYFYYVMSHVAKYVGGFEILLFLYQGLTIIFIYDVVYKYRRSLNVFLAFALYFFLFFNLSLNIMRQCLAMGYLLNISVLLLERKSRRFIFFAILGLIFHTSEIIVAMFIYTIYWLSTTTKVKRQLFIPLYFLCVAILFKYFMDIVSLMEYSSIGRLSDYSSAYQADNLGTYNNTDIALAFLSIIIWWMAFHYKLINNVFYLPMILIIAIQLAFMFLGVYNKWLSRMAMYFTFYSLIFLPYVGHSFKLNKNSRIAFGVVVFSVGLVYWLWINVYRGSNDTIPYEINTQFFSSLK